MLDWLKATGCIFALFLGVFAVAAAAQAGPEDGRIVNGSGSISQSGTHTDIRQNSDFLATHWGSFNIAAHESVQAHQPGASSRLLIRVDGGGGATNIAGNYTSNGITILENRNGVQFSRGAIVNVGGLLATSSRISGVSGANWQLNGTGGAVVNHGQIAAGAGGVVLAAVRVENHGKITAQGGDVALGAGAAFTVDFAGSLVGFEVKKAADGASVVHDGVIESQGGIVSLSAQEAQAVRTNVVSVGGVVKATRLERRGGVVYLSGGTQGIAEVSGDVSASKKVQTTGEYVVVKDGALLKAPEILVGGDFQGKGDVPTARRTLVEAGALLDAGAEGRVIVWSDETTWFNGDISAPDGFAEVSGKEVLASVHLAGIDVGELLLDPADIIIAAAGTGDAVTADIAAADPGMTLTLDVATINEFAGALSLAASDTIMVDGEINKPTGNLTLIAGGVLTLGANITTSAGDLALTGASIELGGTITLTGGAITLTGAIGGTNNTFSAAASGVLTLNSNINTGTSDLTLAGGMGGIALGGDLLLNGGNVIITGAIAEAATSTDDLNIVALDDMTLNSDINLGMGTLTLRAGITSTTGDIGNGGTARQIMAGSLRLRTAALLSATLFTTTSRVGGAVEVRFGTAISPTFPADNWLFSLGQGDLSIRGIDGVTLGTLTVGTISSTGGVVDLRATTITLGVAITGTAITLYADALTGSAVSLTATDGDIDLRTANGTANSAPSGSTFTSVTLRQNSAFGATAPLIFPATLNSLTIEVARDQTVFINWMIMEGRSLSVTAGGQLTVNVNGGFTLGDSADLTLNGMGSIVLDSVIFITARDITLNSGGNITFNRNLILTAARDITLNGTFDGSANNRSFSATATRNLTFLDTTINTGTGTLTLRAVDVEGSAIDGNPAITLTGGGVELNGSGQIVTSNRSIQIRANNNILLAADLGGISTSGGELDLRAGGTITNSGTAFRIQTGSGSLFMQQAGTFASDLFAATGHNVSGSVSLRLRTAAAQDIHPWMASLGNGDFSLHGAGGVRLSRISLLASNTPLGLTRSAGVIDLRAGNIRLFAPLTGTEVNLRTDNIVGDDTNPVGIHATSGDITATRITASGDPDTGRPGLSTAPSFSLTQTSAFGALDTLPFIFAAGEITAITISTRSAQAVQTWMVASGRSLSLTTTDVLTVRVDEIDLGTLGAGTSTPGGILVLDGATIAFTNAAAVNVSARAVTLSGVVSAVSALSINANEMLALNSNINTGAANPLTLVSSNGIVLSGDVDLNCRAILLSGAITTTNNHTLRVFANGNITLGGDITLGTGALLLSADEDNNRSGNISSVGGTARVLMVGALTLRQVSPFGETLFASGSTASGAVALRPRSAVIQQIQPWMTNLGTGSFSLRGVEGITLTAIIVGAAGLERTVGEVDLQATTISLGGNITGQNGITLIADTISFTADVELISSGNTSLTGAISGNQDLTLRADGDVILNNNINLGTGTLAFATAVIRLGSDIELTGGTVTLSVTDMFDGSAINADLTINASVNLTLGSVNLGTGDLIVNNTSMNATTLTVPSTWTARNITLTGAIDEASDNLTINASGVLTLNSGINLGTGALIINAGTRINVPNDPTAITASAININFTDPTVVSLASPEAGFTPAGSTTSTLTNAMFSTTPTYAYILGCADPADCMLGDGSADLIVDPLLEASASITINAGTNALTFGGEGAITITAPTISITAGSIDIGTRSLTITAAGGTITLVGVTSITGTGAASLSLDAATIMGLRSALTLNVPSISLAQNTAFGGGDTAPFTFGMAVTSLTLETAADQTVQGWMVADGRSLSLTSTGGRITATADINAGTGDIILNGARGLTLGRVIGLSNITLTGGDVGLTGAINGDGGNGNRGFTVLASGVLTLNSNIALRSGNVLGLTGTGGIILGDDITISGARTVNLNSAVEGAGNSLTIRTTGGIAVIGNINLGDGNLILIAGEGIGNGNLTPSGIRTLTAASVRLGQDDPFNEWAIVSPILILTTDDPQPVFAWMLPSTGTRALSITSGGDITVGSGMDLSRVDLTLQAATIILESDLTALSVILRARAITRDDANLTITATTGGITGNAPTLDSTVTALTLIAQSAFASSAPFTFDAALASLTLQTAAAQTVHSWMVADDRSLSLTSTGVITVNTDIALGTGNLTLTGATIQIGLAFGTPANTRIVLRGQDVTLTAADGILLGRFTGSGRFRVNLDVASLTVRADGTLTIAADITVNSTATSGGDIRFVGAASPIAFTGARTITGRAIELRGAATGTADLTITASGTLTIDSDITLTGAGFTLALSGAGAIARTGRPRLTADMVSFSQVDALPVTRPFRFIPGSSLAIIAEAAQDVHDWMIRENIGLTVTSSNRVRVVALIGTGGAAGRNLGTGNITLTSTGGAVRILAGISTTGSITLIGVTGGINFNSGAGAKTFSGAAITLSGDVRSDRDLAITASGTLRINNDINIGTNALTLTSGVGAIVATGRPRLTAGMVSFSQVDALPATRPFRFIPSSSLAITTEAAQDVHDWMIRENIDLTVTSSNRVRVVAIIGTGGGAGRNLGTGALSLTSTGGAVRILDNISISNNITLIGGAGGINLNGTATLTGAAITLTGDARGNRALTLDASGTLRINSNIALTDEGNLTLRSDTVVRILAGDISTGGNITLSGGTGGINFNNGAAAKTLSGAAITLTGAARSNRDLAITASGTLTLNNDIDIGTGNLTLTSGAGAIVATGRPRLTASTVSFSQVDALPVTRPFRFIPSSSLAITTEAAQDVHDWMILENINLTVTSSNRVRVVAIIGTGGVAGRNLGTGALSLTSTGGAVRILANISISNNITLSGVTDGINLNGTDTLTGAIITLTGDARGNRDLTLTASGVLTINNNINIGTTGTTLTLTGASLTFGSSVALTAGAYSLSDGRTCNTGTSPSCTTITP